jgi:spore germination protein PC
MNGVCPLYGYDAWENLWRRLENMERQLQKLRKENRELKEKLENIRPVRIEKIEYKIHELHVDTLSGTLNVGLTASGDDPAVGEMVEKLIEKGGTNIVVDDGSEKPVSSEEDSP